MIKCQDNYPVRYYRIDAEGHLREMSIGDRITDIICQVGTAVLSVGGLCWFAYMVIV